MICVALFVRTSACTPEACVVAEATVDCAHHDDGGVCAVHVVRPSLRA
jgi:hypothetical protein